MTVIAAQSVRRCQAPFDSRHRPGRQIASLQGCRDLRRMPAAASPKIRGFEHPGRAGTCGSSLNSRRLADPGPWTRQACGPARPSPGWPPSACCTRAAWATAASAMAIWRLAGAPLAIPGRAVGLLVDGRPCCARQLRSGNCQPRIAANTAMPSSSGASGPAIPSSDIDIPRTTLVISCPSAGRRIVRSELTNINSAGARARSQSSGSIPIPVMRAVPGGAGVPTAGALGIAAPRPVQCCAGPGYLPGEATTCPARCDHKASRLDAATTRLAPPLSDLAPRPGFFTGLTASSH